MCITHKNIDYIVNIQYASLVGKWLDNPRMQEHDILLYHINDRACYEFNKWDWHKW